MPRIKPLLLSPPTKLLLLAAPRRLARWSFWLVATLMLAALIGTNAQMVGPRPVDLEPSMSTSAAVSIAARDLDRDLQELSSEIKELEDQQTVNQISVVQGAHIQQSLSSIKIDQSAGNLKSARRELKQLSSDLRGWQKQLRATLAAKHAKPPIGPPIRTVTAPILIYHYTPGDFERQLQHLLKHGYTTIDLDQLAAGMAGAPLPPKPVVITFDDGFANQMTAFNLLRKYQMKATFYIVNGGAASKYCIGAGRRYDQGYGCGDGYMSWDQIRQLDASGLITIAAHTVDHLALANQNAQMQHFQIIEGKRALEAQIGHPVRHFAYPYGSYNATTLALIKEAGFTTAVSTLPGTVHAPDTIHTLHRTRSVYKLP